MARVDVLMPQMGESIAEGTLSKWLKKLGDEVKRDEPLFEISTDKVDAEIPAPSAGVLAEIKVQEGQTVPVQTLVAVIETDKGAAATAAPATAASPAAPPVAAAQRAPAAPGGTAVSPPSTSPVLPRPSPSSPVVPKGDGAETADERLRRKSTPLVRKIAAEHQVDISTIPGTGFAGRVTKQDILGVIERGAPAPTAPGSRLPAPGASGPVQHPTVEPWPGDRVEPFSKIRKITADHMIMSRRTSAHVTSFFEIDYSRVAELRRKHKAAYAERGVNLTYLAFIAKTCAENLRTHPVVNAAVSGDNIIYRRDVNIGIAVALEWGLIVPVVKRADELSLAGLARTINDLGERARTKKLLPDEIQRGTFTITNPGVFGSYAGAPIINQPQVAILGVGAIEKRPKVVTLADGTDTIAIRTMGMVSMSYDHRVVDGADADRFLSDVKRALEDFPEGAI
ncbi:MAG: 2-oxoglutarate dehydrogenase, E2 component, dihydrolipoamide succinyltransferase [Gemmatimonadetes bacterium]|nr:MAG: 2-oxoglutarate dehydrogenase, E2 component, dihydrolipoamide succinyltransferase [Gemmatimonadota bacterium]PYP07194.1 MAG: 2-oxoglutarate dehydrogenase, E2 component, dihydrolipoamide succinyltransferase [Gemmatimonadota bacterium]PYP75988.1 MAG: 2-oxoglutarate dehydrogenase, E2 component, dihydrolipoamide succinyltransferase [Gemmatimonadota bacterium]